MKTTFTIPELKFAYNVFKSRKILRYYDLNGKKVTVEMNGTFPRINGTNAKIVPLSSEMDFIEYLENNNG